MLWFVVGFLAVGAWSGDPWAGLAAGAICYVMAAQVWPWASCWYCRGAARRRDHTGKVWHFCLVCGGSGRRRRWLARRPRDDG